MSTAQAQQSKSAQITSEESLTLVRNMMRTAISSICYLRNLFPEDCFQDRTISGIQIKSLLPSNDESRTLIDWLEKGVFEALKKKYLRTIIFGVCTDPTKEMETMIESYDFKISYPMDEGAELNICRSDQPNALTTNSTNKKAGIKVGQTKQEITQSMVMMLRTLITLAQTLKPIPDSRYITMKLLYYDEVTPADYEPSFFRAMRDDETRHFNKDFMKLKIGGVFTQHHSMNIRVRTLSESFECADDEKTMLGESFPLDRDQHSEPTSSQWNVKAVPDADQSHQGSDSNPKSSNPCKKDDESDCTQLSEDEERDQHTNKQDTKTLRQELKKKDPFAMSMKDAMKKFSSKFSSLTSDEIRNCIQEERKDHINSMDSSEVSYIRALAYTLTQEFITASLLSSEIGITNYQATKFLGRMETEKYVKPCAQKRKGKKVIENEDKLNQVMEMLEHINEGQGKKEIEEVTKGEKNIPKKKKTQEEEIIEEEPRKKKTTTKEPETSLTPNNKKQGQKRKKDFSKFEVCYSQDGMSAPPTNPFSLDELSSPRTRQNTVSGKISTVTDPIIQKKRKIYRDPNQVPML